ncbi:HTTM domain-containing protein [Roseiconus lacunae]|uniref:HTTM domain-containing protein n=1 Tax=Roseiconus lacunae TaxID=2605694 RepID=UPI0011F0F129|nr:HTTM domain-containing protein [Roseiconus lacunae]
MTALPLAWLRVLVGVTYWFWASGYLADDRWRVFFQQPRFLFKYAGLEWVQPWPGDGMWWHFQLTRLAAVFFAIGFITPISAAILAFSMAFVLVSERQIYNNHDYLLACVALVSVFLPMARQLSVDHWLRGNCGGPQAIRRWQWWLVRFQLGLPYAFGAIAKLDQDWLCGLPTELWVRSRVDTPLIGSVMALPHMNLFIAWGGLLFDALIIPGLYFRRTRSFAITAALVFHLTNATIFTIGVFPWFMLATMWVFFSSNAISNFTYRISSLAQRRLGIANADVVRVDRPTRVVAAIGPRHLAGVVLAFVYVTVQLLLPVRPWLLPGNASWNERGQRFSWRMMLRHKDCLTWFRIETGDDHLFVPANFVMTPNQLRRAPRDPELVRQAAVQLRSMAQSIGVSNANVYALHLVSLNGRRPKCLVDPDKELTRAKRGWWSDDWVKQDPGPPKKPPYRQPFDRWWQDVDPPPRFVDLMTMRPSEAQRLFDQLIASQQSDASADDER